MHIVVYSIAIWLSLLTSVVGFFFLLAIVSGCRDAMQKRKRPREIEEFFAQRSGVQAIVKLRTTLKS